MIDINTIIDELIRYGEDVNEMAFWKETYPHLSDEEKIELQNNLLNELEELKKSVKRLGNKS